MILSLHKGIPQILLLLPLMLSDLPLLSFLAVPQSKEGEKVSCRDVSVHLSPGEGGGSALLPHQMHAALRFAALLLRLLPHSRPWPRTNPTQLFAF